MILRVAALVCALLCALTSPSVAQQTCVTYGKQLCFVVPPGAMVSRNWREIDGNKQAHSFSLEAGVVQFEVVLLRLDNYPNVRAFLDKVYPPKLMSYMEGQPGKRTDQFGFINAPAGQFTLWQADYIFHNGQADPYRQKNVAYKDVGDGYAIIVYAWNRRGYKPLSDDLNKVLSTITVRNVEVGMLR